MERICVIPAHTEIRLFRKSLSIVMRLTVVGFIAILCAAAASEKTITEQNYRVFHGNGSPATLDDVIEAARQANVTFIGENHDDAVGHYLEAEILRRVASPDWALSLEMFERDVQGVIDEYLNGLIE